MAIENIPAGRPPIDDPEIVQAMAAWEGLTDLEKANVFQTVYRAVTAFGRTKDVDHLIRLSESVIGFVLLEQQPGFTEARRAPSRGPGKPDEGVGIAEVIRRLRE